MTRKEEKNLIELLKIAKSGYDKKYAVSSDITEKSRTKIMAYIAAHGSQPTRPLTLAERTRLAFAVKIRVLQGVLQPQFVYAALIFAIFAATASAAVISRNALPGDTLYGAKLAAEGAKVRFTSNPASRAKVQMELAGNRLKEARAITEAAQGQPNGRVEEALSRFARDVEEATATLKQAGDPAQVQAASTEFSEKVAQYRQELEQTRQILEQTGVSTEDPDSAELPDTDEDVSQEPGGGDSAPPSPSRPFRVVELASLENAEKALNQAEEALGAGRQESGQGDQTGVDSTAADSTDLEMQVDEPLQDGEVGI